MSSPQPGCRESSDGKGACPLRCRVEDGFSYAFARLIAGVYRLSGDWNDWHPALSRVSAHASVLIIVVTGIALSSVTWPARVRSGLLASASVPAVAGERPSGEAQAGEETTLQYTGASWTASRSSDVILRQAQLHTLVPERPRLEIITYSVRVGDTVESIADQFGLAPTSIVWANPAVEDAPDLLRIGQEILILPIDGVLHTVDEGDTLASIAETYEVDPEAIVSCDYNDLEGADEGIAQGELLIVPGGEKPYEPRAVTAYAGAVPEGAQGTGRFLWPVLGRITQGYWHAHRAIDIGAPTGSAVLATDGGFVSFAGWTDVGYGYLIVVDHANGFATYYAHLSNMYVAEGQPVERGDVIGAVGNTGNSTGPHLHFEVRYNGWQQNPRAYLP